MASDDWKGSATLSFLLNALGHGIAAVPFATTTVMRTDSRQEYEGSAPHANGSAAGPDGDDTAEPTSGDH